MKNKICVVCSKEYIVTHNHQISCSDICSKKLANLSGYISKSKKKKLPRPKENEYYNSYKAKNPEQYKLKVQLSMAMKRAKLRGEEYKNNTKISTIEKDIKVLELCLNKLKSKWKSL